MKPRPENKISHIYWFTYFDLSEPSIRYRALYQLQELEKTHSITYTIIYPGYSASKILRFIFVYFSILLFRKSNSVIVFQKIRTKRIYGRMLKLLLWLRPAKTVYDIDDADYIKHNSGVIFHFIHKVEKCFAGSRELLKVARQMNAKSYLLTSPVCEHKYQKKKRNIILHIGWIGYYNAHSRSLNELLFPALQQLNIPVKLILLGVSRKRHVEEINKYFEQNKNIMLDIPLDINWQEEDNVYKRVSMFDVGVSPLVDTEINRAKSAFKLKQYLSCGIPVLASSIGDNPCFLQPGDNGYLCDTVDEFRNRLLAFSEMQDEEYMSLSRNAYLSTQPFKLNTTGIQMLKYMSI